MATATLTSTPTTIDEATAVTNWGGDTFATNTSAGINGTCVECIQTTNGNNDVYVTGTWDFTTAVHLRLWFNLTYFENLATSNAIQVFLYDGTNTSYWYWTKGNGYQGGWQQAVIYTGDTPDVDNSVTMSSITRIGMRMVTASKPRNAPFNALYDAWRYGDGFTVTGGTSGDPITWADIATTDAASAYGIVTDNEGVYNLRGAVQIGDGTSTTYFEPSGEVAIFTTEQINTGLYDVTFFDDASLVTNIDISGGVLSGPGTAIHRYTVDASATCNSFAIAGTQFSNSSTIDFHAAGSVTNCSFSDCYQINPSTGTFENNTVSNYDETAVNGALLWPGGTTVKNCSFINCTEGIEIAQTTNQTYDNITFTGENGTTHYSTHLNNGGTSIDVSKNNGSDPVYYTNTGGGVVTFVGAAVVVSVTTQTGDGTAVGSCTVHLRASDGTGSLPYLDAITNIARSGSTATVTHAGTGRLANLANSDKVLIRGDSTTELEYLGVFTISNVTSTTFDYTVSGTPSTPASGTTTVTFVALDGTSNATTGVLSATARVYPTTQPIVGWARKSTSAPYYKQGSLSGDVDTSTGYTSSAVMTLDQ